MGPKPGKNRSRSSPIPTEFPLSSPTSSAFSRWITRIAEEPDSWTPSCAPSPGRPAARPALYGRQSGGTMTDFALPARTVSLADYRGRQPVLLVFYRGWWWPHCQRQMGQLARNNHRFAAAGVALAMLSVDSPRRARQLADAAPPGRPSRCCRTSMPTRPSPTTSSRTASPSRRPSCSIGTGGYAGPTSPTGHPTGPRSTHSSRRWP